MMEFLQFSDCNFAIKRTHKDYFWNMYWKLVVLEKIFWGENLLGTSIIIKLQPCSTQSSIFFSKKQSLCKTSCRSAESSNIFTVKPPWWRPFFTKNLEFVSTISFKRTPTQIVSYMGPAQQLFLNYQNIFKNIF